MSADFELSLVNLATAFGTTAAEVPSEVAALIGDMDLRFRRLDQDRHDEVVLGILQKNSTPASFRRSANTVTTYGRKDGRRISTTSPPRAIRLIALCRAFIRPDQAVRWNKHFVLPHDPACEWHVATAFHEWLFRRYCGNAEAVYEFGCGSGYNLVQLAKVYPSVKLVGLDWAESAVQLVNSVGSKHGLNLTGRRFDFFHPDPSLCIEDGSIVMTMCALEQIGDRFEEFLQFLLSQSPLLCVHHEPIHELYDPSSLVDYLGMHYHSQRGYLSGFLTRLRQLEAERKIELLKVHRLQFGSLYHESYSYVVWRPLRNGPRA